MPVSDVPIRYLSVAGADLSEYVQNCTLTRTVQSRQFLDGGEVHRLKTGLRTDVLTGRLAQDRDAGKVGATIEAAFEGDGATDVVCRPSTGAVSAANPSYTGKVLVTEYRPIVGQRGEIEAFAFTWASSSGPFVRATS